MNKLFKCGLLLFTNDLRRTDNRVLEQAIRSCNTLLLVYIYDESQHFMNEYGVKHLGKFRQKFLYQTLLDLKKELAGIHLHLHLLQGNTLDLLLKLIEFNRVEALFVNRVVNPEFREVLRALNFQIEKALTISGCENSYLRELKVFESMNFNLFDIGQFESGVLSVPDQFADFINYASHLTVRPPFYNNYKNVPASIVLGFEFEQYHLHLDIRELQSFNQDYAIGGATFGLKQIGRCLSDHFNEQVSFGSKVFGFDSDDLLMTPWLSNGSVSMRTLWYTLLEFEDSYGQAGFVKRLLNAILKIEHYQWIAIKQGDHYFHFDPNDFILTSEVSKRYLTWCRGRTSSPLVNACMNQLNQTGYITIVARRVLAGYLINEYSIPWQLGAVYFKMQFIDFDPAVVWGGWREMARVEPNANSNDLHDFLDLNMLAQLRDPNGEYIRKWKGFDGLVEHKSNKEYDSDIQLPYFWSLNTEN